MYYQVLFKRVLNNTVISVYLSFKLQLWECVDIELQPSSYVNSAKYVI